MSHRHGVPTALSAGRAKLHDKAASLLWSYWLEVATIHLAFFLDSFISFTTDMGVEAGLTDFANVDFQQLIPSWVWASEMESDMDGGDIIRRLSFLFRNAMPINGVLHVFHNATREMNLAMKRWQQFWKN